MKETASLIIEICVLLFLISVINAATIGFSIWAWKELKKLRRTK